MAGFVKWLKAQLEKLKLPNPTAGETVTINGAAVPGVTVVELTIVPTVHRRRHWPTRALVWSGTLREWMPILGGPVDLPPAGDVVLFWE